MTFWKMDLAGRIPGPIGEFLDKYLFDEITGHSAHALLGLLPAALVSLPALKGGYLNYLFITGCVYTLAVIFYTFREKDLEKPADNVGDAIWTWSVWFSLLGSWWVAPLLGSLCLGYDIWYWNSRDPDGWMDDVIWPWDS